MQQNQAQAATRQENLIMLLGGIWLTVGLFVDGYAHGNLIDETEDFFTPWHAIFYSGFAVAAGWIGFLMYRRRNPNGMRAWIPPGYQWAVVGVFVFAAGGLGDLIWHQIFGVESEIDALLSPTHMLLLLGLILILAAPLQSAARSGTDGWIATSSLITLSALAAFFTTFDRPISNSWMLSLPYDPPDELDNENMLALAVVGAILASIILAASTIYLVQRFSTVPKGAITALWVIPTVLEAGAQSNDPIPAAIASFVGGAVTEVVFGMSKGQPSWQLTLRRRLIASIPAGVGAMWLTWVIVNGLFVISIGWPPEVWGGLIIMSMLAAAGLVMVSTQNPELTEVS